MSDDAIGRRHKKLEEDEKRRKRQVEVSCGSVMEWTAGGGIMWKGNGVDCRWRYHVEG